MSQVLQREVQVRALVNEELKQRSISVSDLRETTEGKLTILAMDILLNIISAYGSKAELEEEIAPTDPYSDLSHYEVLAILHAIQAISPTQTAD